MTDGEAARGGGAPGHDLGRWSQGVGAVSLVAGIIAVVVAPSVWGPSIDPTTGAYVPLPPRIAADPVAHVGWLLAAAGWLLIVFVPGLLVAVRADRARRSYEAMAGAVAHPRRFAWAMIWAGMAMVAPMTALGVDPALMFALPQQASVGGLLVLWASAAVPLLTLLLVDRPRVAA